MKIMHHENESVQEDGSSVWTTSFLFLNLSFFMVFANTALFYIYPLALDHMGSGHHIVGLVMGIFSTAAVLSRPFLGKLVGLKGESWVMSSGLALNMGVCLAYNLIEEFGPAMLAVRTLHGIGFSAFISGGFSLAAKVFPPAKRGEAFSVLGACLMGTVALAPPFGEFLVGRWGFGSLYITASGSLLLAWVCLRIVKEHLKESTYEHTKTPVKYLGLLKDRAFCLLLISTIIFAHCQATVPNFLALLAAGKGGNSGRFFMFSYFTAILFLLAMGRFIDRFGMRLFLVVAYPFFLLGIFLIPSSLPSFYFLFPAVLYGAGIGLLFPAHNAAAAGHGNEMQKPAYMSLFTAVYDAGFITGGVVSGWFAQKTSLDMLFTTCSVFGLLGFGVVILLSKTRME
ncbi:MAG: MFS transporter [Desulfatiglans sp.]|jgi:MFS family permease|nr:MFS transporter [Desulfatiglans sp.]